MKKNLFIILLSLLLTSCTTGYFTGDFDYEFINSSTKTVAFTIDDVEYSLEAGQSTVINKNNKVDVIVKDHPRIEVTKKSTMYKFIDLEVKKINFYNTTNQKVTIGEQNGMLGDVYNTLVEVAPNETVSCNLYTVTPKFYAFFTESNIPVNLELISIF